MAAMNREALLAAAWIEDELAKHFANKLTAGPIAEGSPAWETLKLHQQAAQRGAALREMADKAEG